MKKAETCRCYDCLIIFYLYSHNKGCVRLYKIIYILSII